MLLKNQSTGQTPDIVSLWMIRSFRKFLTLIYCFYMTFFSFKIIMNYWTIYCLKIGRCYGFIIAAMAQAWYISRKPNTFMPMPWEIAAITDSQDVWNNFDKIEDKYCKVETANIHQYKLLKMPWMNCCYGYLALKISYYCIILTYLIQYMSIPL